MPSTQKALYLDKKFGDFSVGDAEVYSPGPGEVLIKVIAASLNPIDWKIQKQGYFFETFPVIVGADIAGDVEQLGEGVTDFKKGDKVFVQGVFKNRHTGFQQYTIALASTLAKIPENISYDEASTIPVALTAAYVGLYNAKPNGLGLAPPISPAAVGQYARTPIVILGGASSVGQFAIQLAKISGFSPIIATASPKHTAYLQSLGASHVLDRNLRSSELVSQINQITNNAPIRYMYDSISLNETQQAALDILAPGGEVALVLPVSVEFPEDKSAIVVWGMLRLETNIELLETLYHDTIFGFLEKGLIKPNAVEVLPNGLAGIPAGLVRMEADQVSKSKLVAHPQETTA